MVSNWQCSCHCPPSARISDRCHHFQLAFWDCIQQLHNVPVEWLASTFEYAHKMSAVGCNPVQCLFYISCMYMYTSTVSRIICIYKHLKDSEKLGLFELICRGASLMACHSITYNLMYLKYYWATELMNFLTSVFFKGSHELLNEMTLIMGYKCSVPVVSQLQTCTI